MTKEDEENFVEFVMSTGEVMILPYISQTNEFTPIQKLPDRFSGKFSGGFWLFNRGVSSNLVVEYVPAQRYYTIDSLQSSVVEFTRSGVSDKMISRGRIWADFTILDREKMVLLPKEVAFSKWYDSLATWIRKKYKRVDRLTYAGPGAQKLVEEGFTLKYGRVSGLLAQS